MIRRLTEIGLFVIVFAIIFLLPLFIFHNYINQFTPVPLLLVTLCLEYTLLYSIKILSNRILKRITSSNPPSEEVPPSDQG